MAGKPHNKWALIAALVAVASLFVGCATSKINWDNRVGNYTFDQAVVELGPPERSAKLSDGTTVAEWLIYRGRTIGSAHYTPGYGGYLHYNQSQFPDRLLRLTFSPEGRLESWKKVTK
jgi:hypothetical protein